MNTARTTTSAMTREPPFYRHLLKRDGPRSRPLAGQVYDAIWKGILSGRYRPGTKLLDTEIATEWHVSRTPVREALHQLARDGLLEYRARHGFAVSRFDMADVGELYDFRTALEGMATQLAAPRLEETGLLGLLNKTLNLQGRADSDRRDDFLLSDFQLHELIVRGSGNQRIITALGNIQVQLSYFQVTVAKSRKANEAALVEHEAILRSLLEGDAEKARGSMESHIQAVKHRTLQFLTGESGRRH